MTLRALIALVPAVCLVGLVACSADSRNDESEVGSSAQALCSRADPSACGTLETIGTEVKSFSCPCGQLAPGGGFFSVINGVCKIVTKPCCPDAKTGVMPNCPPSTTISAYNPCRYNVSAPYQRCNTFGQCWCSAYP
ncbi:MAG: hypothetical protein U0235_15845 [Polyangiaceae bacterium]